MTNMAVSYMKQELLTLREYTLVFCGVRDSMLLTLREYTPVFGGVRDSVLLISLVFCVVFLVGSVTPCCYSSLLISVLCFWWGP